MQQSCTVEMIAHCFQKAGIQKEMKEFKNDDNILEIQDHDDWKTIQGKVGADFHFADYVSIDKNVLVTEFHDFDKIIADHKEEDDDDDNQSDEGNSEDPCPCIPT